MRRENRLLSARGPVSWERGWRPSAIVSEPASLPGLASQSVWPHWRPSARGRQWGIRSPVVVAARCAGRSGSAASPRSIAVGRRATRSAVGRGSFPACFPMGSSAGRGIRSRRRVLPGIVSSVLALWAGWVGGFGRHGRGRHADADCARRRFRESAPRTANAEVPTDCRPRLGRAVHSYVARKAGAGRIGWAWTSRCFVRCRHGPGGGAPAGKTFRSCAAGPRLRADPPDPQPSCRSTCDGRGAR